MPKRKLAPIADKDEVLAVFTRIMRGEMTEETTRKTGAGEERTALPPKISERCKAAELLGKQLGLFERKEELQPKSDLSAEIVKTLKEMHDRTKEASP